TAAKAEVISPDGRVVLVAPRCGGTWVLEARPVDAHAASTMATTAASKARLWHCRLAHTGESAMKALMDAKAVAGLEGVQSCPGDALCSGCMQGKSHHAAFAKKMTVRLQATRLWQEGVATQPPHATHVFYTDPSHEIPADRFTISPRITSHSLPSLQP